MRSRAALKLRRCAADADGLLLRMMSALFLDVLHQQMRLARSARRRRRPPLAAPDRLRRLAEIGDRRV